LLKVFTDFKYFIDLHTIVTGLLHFCYNLLHPFCNNLFCDIQFVTMFVTLLQHFPTFYFLNRKKFFQAGDKKIFLRDFYKDYITHCAIDFCKKVSNFVINNSSISMTTSEIIIPNRKRYLIGFIETIYKSNDAISRKIRMQIDRQIALLVKYPPKNYAPKPPHKRQDNEIVLPVPKFVKQSDPKYRFYLSRNSQKLLVYYIVRRFYMLFFAWMRSFEYMPMDWRINSFMERWNIDYKHYDMLRKAWYRYRKRKSQSKSLQLSEN